MLPFHLFTCASLALHRSRLTFVFVIELSRNSGLALDVDGGVKTVSAKIDQYPFNDSAWQQWIFKAP